MAKSAARATVKVFRMPPFSGPNDKNRLRTDRDSLKLESAPREGPGTGNRRKRRFNVRLQGKNAASGAAPYGRSRTGICGPRSLSRGKTDDRTRHRERLLLRF